jgi:hypothetical protein
MTFVNVQFNHLSGDITETYYYIRIIEKILDITHRPVFYLDHNDS